MKDGLFNQDPEYQTGISRDMVDYWVGSDTLRSGIIEILWELATGQYDVEQMRQDIISSND